jgi:hypothetical protein
MLALYLYRGKEAVAFVMALLGGYLAFMMEEVFVVLSADYWKRRKNG